MRTIVEFNKSLKIWTTNTEYEKIINCRVIDPTYEKWKWLHNADFFLDKRFGMETFVDGDFHYTDDIVIYGNKYYLYHDDFFCYVWVKDGATIKEITGPFWWNQNNPIKFVEWIGANGTRKETDLSISNAATLDTNDMIANEDWVYEDWYIILDVGTWLDISPGDFVLFKDNVYAGATVEIDLYDDGKIYILWINSKGSIPTIWTKIDIYSDSWKLPVIGTEEWLIAIHINGTDIVPVTNILEGDITDAVKFNEEIFVLKNDIVYFSSRTFNDNLQFYKSSNRKRIRWAYKLISKWKFLLIMWDDNRLVSPVAESSGNFWAYTFYPLNYNSDLYSKYSYIFTDSTLYIVQSDKEIAKIDVSSLNATAFNLDSTPIIDSVRWLLDDIEDYASPNKWEIYICASKNDRRINFLYIQKEGGTINLEYDKHYQHWLIQTYSQNVYKISDQFLCQWHVANIWWFTDFGEEYKQSINFTIQIPSLITKVGLIRNIMGVSNDFKLQYNIDIDVESSHSTTRKSLKIKSFALDTMPVDHSLDMANVLNNWKDNKHNGTIASVQRTIMMSWRYHRYDINWYDRFIYWYSYLLWVPSNIFVNERNFSF